jgi:hypothetical protein
MLSRLAFVALAARPAFAQTPLPPLDALAIAQMKDAEARARWR